MGDIRTTEVAIVARNKKADILNLLKVGVEAVPLVTSNIPSPWDRVFFELSRPPSDLTEARWIVYQLDRLSLAVTVKDLWDKRIRLKLGKGWGELKKQSLARGKLLTRLLKLIEQTPLFGIFQNGRIISSLDPKGIPIPPHIAFAFVFREYAWSEMQKAKHFEASITKSGTIKRLQQENRELQSKTNPFKLPATKFLFDRAISLSENRGGTLQDYQVEIFTPFVEARMAYTSLLREKGNALIKIDTIKNQREIVKRGG